MFLANETEEKNPLFLKTGGCLWRLAMVAASEAHKYQACILGDY